MRGLLISLAVGVLLTLVAVNFADNSVTRWVHAVWRADDLRLPVIESPILVLLSAMTVIAGAVQILRGHSLGKLMDVSIIASFSLTWSVCINEFVLKFIFGRKTPDEFLRNGVNAFHWFHGTPFTPFPSGHAVQIVSVGTVFFISYPQYRFAWFALMGLGLTVLVLVNRHFLSDVIAGSAFGALGGVATMKLWRNR